MNDDLSTIASEPTKRVRETNFSVDRKFFLPADLIPGYILYWPRGEPGRIAGLLRRGWEWVSPEEVQEFIVNTGIGSDTAESGASDLGSKVSVPAQEGVGPDGQYLRHYLMKLKKEYWDEDMEKYIKTRIEPIVEAFASGMVGVENDVSVDRNKRYRPKVQQLPEMFRRKAPKASA
jgi:hypothetical protein